MKWWPFTHRIQLPRTEANIGNILLAMGVLDRAELNKGIEVKLASDRDQLLGEVLIARGFITRTQLERALHRQAEIIGPRPYADQIRMTIAKGRAAIADAASNVTELKEAAEKLTKRGETKEPKP
jgi:ubiquinone biosynthesis protein UbiJ